MSNPIFEIRPHEMSLTVVHPSTGMQLAKMSVEDLARLQSMILALFIQAMDSPAGCPLVVNVYPPGTPPSMQVVQPITDPTA